MTPEYEQEITANLERAEQSIKAAKDLAVKGYHDFEASRAYYAAFYGAAAVLLNLAAMAALAICLWFFCRAMKGGQHER